MIYVTGDVHMYYDIDKLFPDKFPAADMTKDDYVIICGDFGGIWNYKGPDQEERDWLDWYQKRPFTTLFVDGNHENFNRLYEFPEEMWQGGKIHIIRPGVYHLMRGYVFNLQGRTFFTFGGASSHDRGPYVGNTAQVINKYWWPQELPTQEEMARGIQNLSLHNNQVDFIITHCLPDSLQDKIVSYGYDHNYLTAYLEKIKDSIEFHHWYCGHFHHDVQLTDSFTVLYKKIIQIV